MRQNRVRPGSDVAFATNSLVATGLDAAGAVVIPLKLDWGETGKFIPITPNSPIKELFGKSLTELVPIREAFKATGRVIIYNLSGNAGEKATATSDTDDFTVTAAHTGSVGNKIIVTVVVGLTDKVTVRTHFEGAVVDSQVVEKYSDLVSNAYVVFSGKLPSSDATLKLAGGTTAEATNESYSEFAAGLDTQRFKVLAVGTDDETVKMLLTLKVKQWREIDIGKNVTLVTNDYKAADHEGVVSVLNGVTLTGGEFLSAENALYWYAGAYANANSESLTYEEYPGAIDVETLSHDEIVAALQDGHIVYTYNAGADGVDRMVVEQDINTFRSFTPEKNQDFRKNKIIRGMDELGNNVRHIYSRYFIGKVINNDDGRDIYKGQVMKVALDPLVPNVIDAYNPDELIFEKGSEKDAVLVTLGVEFVDAMEKQYVKVNCK